MAVKCDYCGDPITDAYVQAPPPVLPPDPNKPDAKSPLPMDLHPECARPYWQGCKKVNGARPTTPPPAP